jgi:hypothetical protein
MKNPITLPPSNRRVFFMTLASTTAVLTTTRQATAQAMVSESEAQAVTLGYKADATKVDKAKQPKYVAGSVCSNCALFQGGANAKAGACPLFAGKQVAAPGWCNGWVKKA